MDTELINILITAAVTLVSGGGVAAVAAVMYRKQNKRLKESEATAAELRNSLDKIEIKDKEREYHDNCIDDLHESIDKMQKHFAEQTEQNISKDAIIKEKDGIIEDKTQHIRRINDEHSEEIALINREHAAEVARLNEEKLELQRQLTGKEAYIGRLKLFVQWLKHWHCKRETGKKKGQCVRREPEQDVPTPFSEYPDKELVAELGGVTVCEAVNGSGSKKIGTHLLKRFNENQKSLDLRGAKNWGLVSPQSLQHTIDNLPARFYIDGNNFNMVTAGSTCKLLFSPETKAALTDAQKLQITDKNYTIA